MECREVFAGRRFSVSNAAKYTIPGGRHTVIGRDVTSYVLIALRNSFGM